MDEKKKGLTRSSSMIQLIGVLVALLGLAYNGVKDYQKGEIQIPKIELATTRQKPVYPVQYCLMAYDPNTDKFYYQHENGQWYDFAPQIRKYQNQGQEALGNSYGTQGTQGYRYGQQAQATANTQRY